MARARLSITAMAFAAFILGLRAQQQQPQQLAPAAGTIVTNSKDGLRYAYIPPGRFQMGCSAGDTECFDDERPAHEVRITKGFWMSQTEVTVEAYKRYVRATAKSMPADPTDWGENFDPGWKDNNLPMSMISWTGARDYCAWAGALRLPTEAEWEYAARAGSNAGRYGALDEIAWVGDNSGNQRIDSTAIFNQNPGSFGKSMIGNGNRPHAVALKQANAFKLYDMLGNVWEWTADWYDDQYYQASPKEDPRGPSEGLWRTMRGGSWIDRPVGARVSARGWAPPDRAATTFGFRCVGEKLVP